MPLQRDATREGAKGLGGLFVRELSPNLETVYSDLGWLSEEGTTIDPQAQVLEHKDQAGNLSQISIGETSHKFSSYLAQVGQDEMDFIRNSAGKTHSLRYYGMMNPFRWQYKCAEFAQIVPYIPRTWKAGKQNLPITAFFLKQDNTVFDTPEYYDIETLGYMNVDNLALWVSPRRKWNDATSRILDISGFAQHGTLAQTSGGPALIWTTATTPERFLRFDGITGNANFGNVCDPAALKGVIEFWVRVQGANGSVQPIISKKTASGSGAGFWIERGTGNQITVYFSDGTHNYTFGTADTALINVWKHILIGWNSTTIETIINGSVGSSASLTGLSLGSLSNSVNLHLGCAGSSYGQVDIGDVRIHLSSSDLDTEGMAVNHYAAEKAIYGL